MKPYIRMAILLVTACMAAIGLMSCDKDCPVCPPKVPLWQ